MKLKRILKAAGLLAATMQTMGVTAAFAHPGHAHTAGLVHGYSGFELLVGLAIAVALLVWAGRHWHARARQDQDD